LTQADAELALGRIHQEMPELDHKGPIQPQVGPELTNLIGRGVLP
jgi:hypothetical protein